MFAEGPSGEYVPGGLLYFAHKVRGLAQTSPEGWGTFPFSPAVRGVVLLLAGVHTEEVLS